MSAPSKTHRFDPLGWAAGPWPLTGVRGSDLFISGPPAHTHSVDGHVIKQTGGSVDPNKLASS